MQAKFKGKARATYNNLTLEESKGYDAVKEAILRTVQVDPEIRRKRFGGVRKLPNGTYLELGKEFVMKADRWVKAAKVMSKKMFQLMVMEHFMDNSSSEIRQEVIKCEIKDVVDTGRKADQICSVYGSRKSDVFYEGLVLLPDLRRVKMGNMVRYYEHDNVRGISGNLTAMSLRRTVTQKVHWKTKDSHECKEVRP